MEKIGFIGLGLMGLPMSKRLLSANYELVVYNRSQKPVEELVKMGAERAASPKEIAERSGIVFTMLPDSPDVKRVLLEADGVVEGMKPGGMVVDCSTISPLVEVEIAESLRQRKIEMLDAPVTGGTTGAEKGTLTFMVGGKKEAFDRCLPLFKAMGRSIFHMGDLGMGSFTKICNQMAVSLNLLGTCEALLLASKAGLDVRKVLEVLGTGGASSYQLVNLGPKMVERDFRPGFKIAQFKKDLRIAREISENLRLPTLGAGLTYELLKAAHSQGLGDNGTQALIKALEQLAQYQLRK